MARKTVSDNFLIFPQRLSELMKERKLTQQNLADSLGVKRQTVSLYMSGQSMPDAEQLKNIALFFGVSADWLLGLSNVRPVSYNEETPASLGLSGDFVKHLVFLRANCFNGEDTFFNTVLGSKYFFDAIKAIVRLWNIPRPDTDHPSGIDGCTLVKNAEAMSKKVLQQTDNQYTVCRSDTAVDGLIFRAQYSFASAIEDSYYNKGK